MEGGEADITGDGQVCGGWQTHFQLGPVDGLWGGLHQARQLWSRARIGRDDAFHVVQVEFNVLFEILD